MEITFFILQKKKKGKCFEEISFRDANILHDQNFIVRILGSIINYSYKIYFPFCSAIFFKETIFVYLLLI